MGPPSQGKAWVGLFRCDGGVWHGVLWDHFNFGGVAGNEIVVLAFPCHFYHAPVRDVIAC